MGTIHYEEYLVNSQLLHPTIQRFINENLQNDVQKLLLSNKKIEHVSIKEIVKQIECKKKSKKKLPTWFETPNILYHKKINIEQTSSEITAHYKAQLFSGESMIDLTSGFGVDAYYFSKQFQHITLCERNNSLLEKVKHNYQQLDVSNASFYEGNSIEYLKSIQNPIDLIYVDPARRNEEQKVFLLEDCMPNIIELQSLLFEKSHRILIKLSPLFDIKELTRKLKGIKTIYIIAIKNEVKELLVELEKDYKQETTIVCENLETSQPTFTYSINTLSSTIHYASEVASFLYEPNAAIYKSGAFNLIATQFDLKKLAQNSHLYTSDVVVKDFPGKIYKVNTLLNPQTKTLKKALNQTHYNIISRNYPLKVAEIKKKYKLLEGGVDFIIFTQIKSKKIALLCERFS
ncbi:tRNA (uracil(54)-C(5))-methyltransferase [Flavobacteriaceae bacterium UJ101]|nr:tRNA (uracil(54)-C(5))-methyltransferase [Flavobacteriaceae bacterium UJ101]